MATFVNLNCFITATGNNAQIGGTWKYGTITSFTPPASWSAGTTISNGNVNITDFPDGKTYPFTYTIGSGNCIATTTYTLNTAVKLNLSGVNSLPVCVANNTLSGNVVNLTVVSQSPFNWSVVSSNPNITVFPTSGSGTSNLTNISFTVSGPTNGTTTTNGLLTVNLVPQTTLNTFPLSCINYNPVNSNPCGDIHDINVTIHPNISAGTTKTSTICTNSLTYNSFDTFFNGTVIKPTGYTETYFVDNNQVNLPYTFSATPTTQTLKRRISNNICTTETSSTVNISSGASSGISTSDTICNN